ncbi:MAG: hypothetical protein ACEQSB_06305, partial [Undibacterium sp.]
KITAERKAKEEAKAAADAAQGDMFVPKAENPAVKESLTAETTTPQAKLPEGVFQDVIDSIEREVEHAQERRDRLQTINDKMHEQSRGIPGSFVTGRSNQHKGLMRMREGMNNRMSKVFDQLQDAEKKLREAQQKLTGYASGEFHENGQPRANSPSRKQGAAAVDEYGDYLRATVKKGDRITFTPNPSADGSIVKSVNKKTITLEGGTSWSFDHFMPWKDGKEMTRTELSAGLKKWRQRSSEGSSPNADTIAPSEGKSTDSEVEKIIAETPTEAPAKVEEPAVNPIVAAIEAKRDAFKPGPEAQAILDGRESPDDIAREEWRNAPLDPDAFGGTNYPLVESQEPSVETQDGDKITAERKAKEEAKAAADAAQGDMFSKDKPTAQRMGLFDRWDKKKESAPAEVAAPTPENKQLTGANLRRMISTLGESMYAKNLAHTIGKEVFQNAVDAVKSEGDDTGITYLVDTSNRFVLADNGPGMLPERIVDKFLPAFESGKGVGEGGGFGMAKLAFLGGPKEWEMVTRAKMPDGQVVETTLKGTGDAYLDFVTNPPAIEMRTDKEIHLARGMTMISRTLPAGTRTGTALRFDTKESMYSAIAFVDKAKKFVPEVQVRKSYQAFDDLGDLIQNPPNKNIDPGATGQWGLMHRIDLPEATIEIIAQDGSPQSVVKYLNISYLNRSILQFDKGMYLGQSGVLLPSELAVNIKPTVEAGTVGYPFANTRESVSSNVTDAVVKYLHEIGSAAADEMNQKYAAAKDASPEIEGTPAHLFDAGGKVPAELLAKITSAPEMKDVTEDVQRIQEAIIKTLARKHGPTYGRASFAGLLTGGQAYGVHFGKADGPSQIYHDVWLTHEMAAKEAEERIKREGVSNTEDQATLVYDAFLAKTAGVALHEALHQGIRSEGEELARGLTFNAGDIVDTVVSLIKTDRTHEHTERLNRFLRDTGSELAAHSDDSEARRVFNSQGGYQGYSLGKQGRDGKGTKNDRRDGKVEDDVKPFDAKRVANYLSTNGTPTDAIESESERVSAALAPNQPDLFTAATAPDAQDKLGDVKVGTMSALGAYRTLTAKRAKLGSLSTKEEQQLLDAETALGQKLAFDMDAVKGNAPATPEQSSVVARPVFGQNRRDMQDEISRKGEIDRSGQIALFSIGKPSEVFNASLKDAPNSYTYTDESRTNFRDEQALAGTADEFGGITPQITYSEGLQAVTRGFT